MAVWIQRKYSARSRVPSLSVLLSVPPFPVPHAPCPGWARLVPHSC